MAAMLQRLPGVRVGQVDVTAIARDTIREFSDDDVPGLAAEMAYHSLLALFPFLLMLVGLTSIVQDVFGVSNLTDRIVNQAAKVMPEDATSLIRSFTQEVVRSQGVPAIVFGLLGALWAASTAMTVAMKGLNRAYDVRETRGFVRKHLEAIALTLGFTALLIVAAGLLAVGPVMAGGIGKALGWQSEFVWLWNVLTIPAAIVLLTLAVAVFYWLAPNTRHTFRWITPGAVLFIVGWIIASLVFAYYVSNFGAYNRTYGSIGAVIILLVWLYYTDMLLFVGGELNAVLARRVDEEYRGEHGDRPSPAGSKAKP